MPQISSIPLSPEDFEEKFIHSAGKGGQNVNKVATAVQLRVKLQRLSLPDWVILNVKKHFGQSYLADGDILMHCDSHRGQLKNRNEVKKRFYSLWNKCWVKPRVRKATRPSNASVQKRLDFKKKQSQRKRERQNRNFNS